VGQKERDSAGAVKRFIGDVARGIAVDLTAKAIIFIAVSLLAAFALLVVQGGTVPAWVAALAVLVALMLGLALRGRTVKALRGDVLDAVEDRDERGLAAETFYDALVRYEAYSGHLAQALDALQRIVSKDIDVPIPHYIEAGVLEPARDLITDKPAEQVRLSVLLPDDSGERWWMPWAAGHSVTGKAKYNERIVDTLARHAFETGEPQSWPDVESDSAFRQNPLASYPTRALISLPLRRGDEVVGVFNVVSSEPDAFDPAEDTYIASLAGVTAVAVGVFLKDEAEAEASGSE
jgi:GAF domain-containing protein